MDIVTLDKLEQLGELKKKGIITQFEFETQKEKLLFRERLSIQNEPQKINSGENILSAVIEMIIGIAVLLVIIVIVEKTFP